MSLDNAGDAVVCVVDDDQAIRDGLMFLLRCHGYEPRVFPSAEAFLEYCAEPLPRRCMAVLDLSMPGMDGLALQAELQRRHINIPVLFLSGDGDVPMAVNAVKHGAIDFMEKPVDSNALLERVAEGLSLGTAFGEEPRRDTQTESRLSALTRREREVLEQIAEGKTSKSIAVKLGISERTVELHRSRILKKMGARNSTELLNQVLPALPGHNPVDS